MPYVGLGAVIEVHYGCSVCGHEGFVRVDGMDMVDNSFMPEAPCCEKCGAEQEHWPDGYIDSSEPVESEWESIGKEIPEEE